MFRPWSCMPAFESDIGPENVDCNIELNANRGDNFRYENLLNDDFSPIGEQYNRTSGPAESHIGSRYRPKSAMDSMRRDPYDPYTTTYDREYWGFKKGAISEVDGPYHIRTYPYGAQRRPTGPSTYKHEYCKKRVSVDKTDERITYVNPADKKRHILTVASIKPLLTKYVPLPWVPDGSSLKSIYGRDYLGIQQGIPIVPLANVNGGLPAYNKDKKDLGLYTNEMLKGNTTRYGCNKLKNVPAQGTVPAIPMRAMKLRPDHVHRMNRWTEWLN